MARKARKAPPPIPPSRKSAANTPSAANTADDPDNGYASSTHTDNFEDADDGSESEPEHEAETPAVHEVAKQADIDVQAPKQDHKSSDARATLLQPVTVPEDLPMTTPRVEAETTFPAPAEVDASVTVESGISASVPADSTAVQDPSDPAVHTLPPTELPLSSAELHKTESDLKRMTLDDEDNAKATLLGDRTVSLAADESKVPPSVGATSMIVPDETISNPFASAAAQPASEGRDSLVPSTESDDASKHLSTISLGSTAASAPTGSGAQENKRNTITASSDLEASKESTSLPSGAVANYDFLLARLELQNKRLSDDPKSIRASIDGAVKLRENFEKLREQGVPRRSRTESQNRGLSDPAASQTSASTDSKLSRSSIATSSVLEEPHPSAEDTTLQNDSGDLEQETIDWEFWGDVMSNYQQVARTQPRQLSRAIQAGIPAALRGMMWQLMSSSKNEELEIIYAFYLKQSSTHEKAIRRDLNRTFPEQEYFKDGKGIGQENLYNVIKAYSLYDPEVGYCQGMQFVVGPLLLNMPDEEAFSTFVRLMKSYDLRGHFTPNMPALQLRLFQFDRLLEDFLPLLYRHLVRQGVKSSMYASQWFMTLFSYKFPLELVYRILDSVFAEGVEALFRFAIALMRKNEDALLELNFDSSVEFLKVSLYACYAKTDTSDDDESEYRTNEFVRDAFQIKITPFMLDQYAAEFDQQVRATNAHRREVDALRLVNRNLAARVKALEDQLNSVNAEHVEMVKDVVMAKIAKEEMAEDLVRYKMMYAEAVLQADQDSSNHRRASNNSTANTSGHSYHAAFGTYNTSRQSS